ncbi:MAG TPA: hypothetical protein VFS08_02260, partial [Gemmatimonadaceae bacterium]|nr:hypothetical protein [Gemmatimonadaceae bacterium]
MALPSLPAALVRAMLPLAEREEVLADLGAEYDARVVRDGRVAARWWLWRQVTGSLPALARRSWWRGRTGFDPRANVMRPGGPMLERAMIELRFVLRRLRTRPTYTLLAVLTLALGVGGSAAMAGIVRAVLLDPLPYRAEQKLVHFWGNWTPEEFLFLRDHAGRVAGVAGVAAYVGDDVTLEQPDAPTRLVPGAAASSELFATLGVAPLVGPGFAAGDDVPGSEP